VGDDGASASEQASEVVAIVANTAAAKEK